MIVSSGFFVLKQKNNTDNDNGSGIGSEIGNH